MQVRTVTRAAIDEDAPNRISHRQPLLRAVEIAIMAAPLLVAAAMGYRQRWVAEDAFITLRVVDNLLAGHGPVFNIGERVEVYTHPLWLLIITLLGATGIQPEYSAAYAGLVFSLVGIASAQLAALRLTRQLLSNEVGTNTLAIPVGMLVFVSIPVVWDFITSGLETGLSFAWLGISFLLLVRRSIDTSRAYSGRSLPLLEAAFFGLGPLVRPDLGLFSLTFLAVLIGCHVAGYEGRKLVMSSMWLLLAFGSVLGAYQIFRMGYFAALVPNTALAKEAGSANWDGGWDYLLDLIGTYHLWLPLGIVLAGIIILLPQAWRTNRRGTLVLITPVIAALLHALYVVRLGGDFMHGRLLLPALFGLLMPLAAVPVALPRRASVRTIVTWAGLGCIGVWVVVCAFFLRWSFEGTIIRDGIPEGIVNEREFFVLRTGSSHPMTVDDYLGTSFDWVEHGYEMRLLAGTNPRIVLTDYGIHPLGPQVDPRITLVAYARSIGVQSHAAGDAVHLVDLLGLGDPLASRMASQEEERPGHAKGLPQVWIHARYADLTHVRFLPDDLQAASASLQCGDAARLVKAVNAPLTWRLFATNVRDSWRLSTLSIDPDPLVAYEELCRNGR